MNAMRNGFTLIELMIVVAVVGVLAAIAVSSYYIYVVRAEVSEGVVLASGAQSSVAEFYVHNSRFPASNASAGLAMPTSIVGQYVSSVDVGRTPGKVISYFGGPSINGKLVGGFIAYSANAANGQATITWNCKASQSGANATNIPDMYLPFICRR
jgi:type IV pilus assembly protein PilA